MKGHFQNINWDIKNIRIQLTLLKLSSQLISTLMVWKSLRKHLQCFYKSNNGLLSYEKCHLLRYYPLMLLIVLFLMWQLMTSQDWLSTFSLSTSLLHLCKVPHSLPTYFPISFLALWLSPSFSFFTMAHWARSFHTPDWFLWSLASVMPQKTISLAVKMMMINHNHLRVVREINQANRKIAVIMTL